MSSFDFEIDSPPDRPGRPLHVFGAQPCAGVAVERDPYIALNVKWQFWATGLLYLWLKGPGNGYVELKLDERTGALWQLVVITLPPPTERPALLGPVDPSVEPASIRLDPRHWQWRHTPDYSEPAERNLDHSCELSSSTDDERLTLWFSHELVDHVVACGDVRVGVAVNNELVALSAALVPETEVNPGRTQLQV